MTTEKLMNQLAEETGDRIQDFTNIHPDWDNKIVSFDLAGFGYGYVRLTATGKVKKGSFRRYDS